MWLWKNYYSRLFFIFCGWLSQPRKENVIAELLNAYIVYFTKKASNCLQMGCLNVNHKNVDKARI